MAPRPVNRPNPRVNRSSSPRPSAKPSTKPSTKPYSQRKPIPGPAPNRATTRVPAAGLIHGRNAVLEAARAGRVVKVYQASGLGHDPRLDELAGLARIEVVTPDRLDVLAPGVHQGVAAELQPRREWSLKELLSTDPSLLVALDSIMDPMNLGAILRRSPAPRARSSLSTAARPCRPRRSRRALGRASCCASARFQGCRRRSPRSSARASGVLRSTLEARFRCGISTSSSVCVW
jgi:hypothetical protein